ncbi:MAG: hypothetical protein OXC44_01865 [Proteobacteria bacterium]|nr:hypothetical protein [Pseudomonadota bacterium]
MKHAFLWILLCVLCVVSGCRRTNNECAPLSSVSSDVTGSGNTYFGVLGWQKPSAQQETGYSYCTVFVREDPQLEDASLMGLRVTVPYHCLKQAFSKPQLSPGLYLARENDYVHIPLDDNNVQTTYVDALKEVWSASGGSQSSADGEDLLFPQVATPSTAKLQAQFFPSNVFVFSVRIPKATTPDFLQSDDKLKPASILASGKLLSSDNRAALGTASNDYQAALGAKTGRESALRSALAKLSEQSQQIFSSGKIVSDAVHEDVRVYYMASHLARFSMHHVAPSPAKPQEVVAGQLLSRPWFFPYNHLDVFVQKKDPLMGSFLIVDGYPMAAMYDVLVDGKGKYASSGGYVASSDSMTELLKPVVSVSFPAAGTSPDVDAPGSETSAVSEEQKRCELAAGASWTANKCVCSGASKTWNGSACVNKEVSGGGLTDAQRQQQCREKGAGYRWSNSQCLCASGYELQGGMCTRPDGDTETANLAQTNCEKASASGATWDSEAKKCECGETKEWKDNTCKTKEPVVTDAQQEEQCKKKGSDYRWSDNKCTYVYQGGFRAGGTGDATKHDFDLTPDDLDVTCG